MALVVIATGVVAAMVISASTAEASSGFSQISAGNYHTCAVTTSGGAECWGEGGDGELGDGTTANSSLPVDVSGLTGGVAEVSAGGFHSCAVTTSGGAECWGSNNPSGELGDGTTTDRDTPVDVSGLTSGVAEVSAGGNSSCALTTGGGVKCWGDNSFGQLGDGSTTGRDTPVDVSGLTSGVAAVSAGDGFTCALTTGGGVKCWGDNYFGQLGDGNTTESDTPVDVSGLTSGVAEMSAGAGSVCALTTAGGAECWGDNANGELGDGNTIESDTPVDVSGLTSGVAEVSAGGYQSCAVAAGGGTKCWGENNDGDLGDGSTMDSHIPVDVVGLTSGVAEVSAGYRHTCAVATSGGADCWGYDEYGELGCNTITYDIDKPVGVGFTATTTTLKLKWSKLSEGANERFTVTVTATGFRPTGSIEIDVDGAYFASRVLKKARNKGKAILTLPMNVGLGSHTVQGVYEGAGQFSPSVSPVRTVVVS